ncbi:MAG: hypothetical protein JJU29_01975 [Verrucomicrobia bacterium]|nr:hypothetical protein [Verrucomicrobiota bacterium]MCH8512273.1 hypothetical protein [Kiritimatiellia bacterium]
MKLIIAGNDRSEDLAKELEQSAARHPDGGLLSLLEGEAAILCLKDAPDEFDYRVRHLLLIRSRHSVDPTLWTIPLGRGVSGRLFYWIRRILWKLLFPFLSRMAFEQNTVNQMLMNQLVLEHQTQEKARRELDRRLRELENRMGPVAEEIRLKVAK